MKQAWPFAAVALLPGIVFFLVFVGYAAGEVYLHGNCDQLKYGCLGNVQFAALIAGVMLVCSASGHLLACSILRKTVRRLAGRRLVWVVLALVPGQGGLNALIDHFPGGPILMIMVAWAALSAVMALIVLAVARTWPPDDPLKPTPHRSASWH